MKQAFDTMKTNNRISQELPNCNWLENKIKDLEMNRRAEECRKQIEEELKKGKKGKSIPSGGEPQLKRRTSATSGVQAEPAGFVSDESTKASNKFLKETPVSEKQSERLANEVVISSV